MRMSPVTHDADMHDSFIRVTGVRVCVWLEWHDVSTSCVTWPTSWWIARQRHLGHAFGTCIWDMHLGHDSCHMWYDSLLVNVMYVMTYLSTSCVTWRANVVCVTWLIYTCDMTRCMWRLCVIWSMSASVVTWLVYMKHDSFIRATWLIHVCDMTHSYVRHDSFMCVTWLIHTCDMTDSYVWQRLIHIQVRRHKSRSLSASFGTWLIHMFDMRQSSMQHNSFTYRYDGISHALCPRHLGHDSFICVTLPIHSCNIIHSYTGTTAQVTQLVRIICNTTHSYVWHDSFVYAT